MCSICQLHVNHITDHLSTNVIYWILTNPTSIIYCTAQGYRTTYTATSSESIQVIYVPCHQDIGAPTAAWWVPRNEQDGWESQQDKTHGMKGEGGGGGGGGGGGNRNPYRRGGLDLKPLICSQCDGQHACVIWTHTPVSVAHQRSSPCTSCGAGHMHLLHSPASSLL